MAPRRKLQRIVEITVIGPWEAGEAVENFFMDSGALGTAVEKADPEDPVERVRGYFPAATSVVELERSVRLYLEAVKGYFPSPRGWRWSVRIIRPRNWQEAWKAFFKTIRVTAGIVIKPTWDRYEPGRGERVIEMDPGMAFGTGLHATTRLCLEAIEGEIDRRIAGSGGTRPTVLDVGTGSGILAIAAVKLGAGPVVGIDVDGTAVRVARQNARRNRVEGTVEIRHEELWQVDGRFDLVVANIDFQTLAALRAPLVGRVSEGGRLILSGVVEKQAGRLAEIYERGGVHMVEEKRRDEWCCLIAERSLPWDTGRACQ